MVPKVVSEVVPKVVSTLISTVVPGNAIVSKMVSKKGIWCGIYAAPKVIPKTHACYTSIKIGAIHGWTLRKDDNHFGSAFKIFNLKFHHDRS